ncbi:TetR family transcriptional regulator [Actinoplanes sp. NPDC049548]|uniref:TetR/AcrR family transcriptional regulator n=1 Tax=Actinoplanes sp. NPDC049548 TaxID=3155152 RepID=UPI00342F67BB
MNTALNIVDTQGVEALSMRKLAAELGVNPMSLYHHVENKAAVLAGIVALVTEGARDVVVGEGTWQVNLYKLAYEFRELTLRHRNLVRHAFTSEEFIQREGPMWHSLCAILRHAGLPEAEVPKVGAVVSALIGGLLLTEVNGTMRRLLGDDDAEDTGFALAVWLLIDGVAARV